MELMPCGHPKSAVTSSDEGTSYCGACEAEQKVKSTIPKCETCGSEGRYNSDRDAYYCPRCNIWLEGVCDDPECIYCRDRPEVPNENNQD